MNSHIETQAARIAGLDSWLRDKDQVIFSQQARIAELEADSEAMAEGISEAHKYNGAYVISDYSHPEFEISHDRYPCACTACLIAAKYRRS